MGRILELETDLRQIEGLRHYVLTGTETTLPDSVNDEVKEQITNRLDCAIVLFVFMFKK